MTKYEIGFLSIGMLIRGLFILMMLIYLFFFCNTKYKNLSIGYVFLLLLYCIAYFVSKTELLTNTAFFINDFTYLFKYIYFLLLFITILNFYHQFALERETIIKIFVIDLSAYVFLIILPFITNSSFTSYYQNKGYGVVGWFYAANDISNILAILFPLLIYSMNKKFDFFKVLLAVFAIFSSFLIGTKVAYFGLLLTIVFSIIYYLFFFKKRWKHLIMLVLLLLFAIFFGKNSYVIENIKNRIDRYDHYQDTGTNEIDDDLDIIVKDGDSEISLVLLSSRDRILQNTYDIYKTRALGEKLFGIGFSNRPSVDNSRIEKLIEMDFFDVLFHGGIILVILYLLPYLFLLSYFVNYLKVNKWHIDMLGWTLGYAIGLGFCISCFGGHLFSSPAVLIYYTMLLILFLDVYETEKKLKKRISFLLLHLGNGGIERSTINTANALAKYFDIELVVTYKLSEELLYDVDKKIKITYLIDSDIALRLQKYKEMLKRRELRALYQSLKNDYFKTHRFKNFWKDVSDGCRVLVLKRKTMINYLKQSDSDIIISTRMEYSTLLSQYGHNNCKKIMIEHQHHRHNAKYIKKFSTELKNINYLVALTESLRSDYYHFIARDAKTEIVCIPNMIVDFPRRTANLKSGTVISIGRLVEGKRVDEIVEVAAKIPKVNFEIIGDGDQMDKLKKLIDEKNINNVNLLGQLKNDEALKHLSKASLFIMTSVTECLPMVLLEAFSYGVPVVAYQTESGVSDIVDDGINGYVIQNRHREEMIERVNELMNDPKKRQTFGKEAKKKALSYSEEEVIKKWLEIL